MCAYDVTKCNYFSGCDVTPPSAACLPRTKEFVEKSCFCALNKERAMPPRTKRQRQLENILENARELKMRRLMDKGASTSAESEVRSGQHDADSGEVDLVQLTTMTEDALDTDDDAIDPSFNLDSSLRSDLDLLRESFCDDWVSQLEREGLCFQLSKHFDLGDTKVAEIAGIMVKRSDRTAREWRKQFLEEGEVPESKQGKYQKSGVPWSDESLNKKAKQYIRENACVKGKPNLTVGQFCEWVNNNLLPNETLEPGFPRKVSVETSRKWMVELGFNVVRKKKGTYVDGHELLLVKIADAKHPKADGWQVVWISDHSSCHAAMPSDALDVSKMNVYPGGKQRVMRDGWWGGNPQSMNFALGVPKGLRRVLEERGVDTRSMKTEDMHACGSW